MMLSNKDFVLNTLTDQRLRLVGKALATNLQERSSDMTGTELYAEEDYLPSFTQALAKMNMKDRPVGFVCKSTAGRVVKLLQPYDSTVYTGEPEEYPALYGFVWSTDPAKALPFVATSTSPYNKGECCTEDGVVYISNMDNNVWSPSSYPQGWTKYVE